MFQGRILPISYGLPKHPSTAVETVILSIIKSTPSQHDPIVWDIIVIHKPRLAGSIEGYLRQSPSSSGHTMEEPSVIHPCQA